MSYKKKLIEVALPLAKINAESVREKGIRQGHPSTLHLWWARRPLAAARAVLWASLVDDPSSHPDKFPTLKDQANERKRLFDILERLVPWEARNDHQLLADARAEIINSCDGELPKILDPFGGGGAIPLEAARLGLPTFSGDLNPVSVIIQKSMIEIPHKFANKPPAHLSVKDSQTNWTGTEGIAADVLAYSEWMLHEAWERIGQHYPDVTLPDGKTVTPTMWIWARTVKSPDPSWPGNIPLVRSWDVARKTGQPTTWIAAVVDHEMKKIRYEVRAGGVIPEGVVNRQGGVCIATGASIPFKYIRSEAQAGRMGENLMAIAAEVNGKRIFVSATSEPIIPPQDNPIEGEIFDWPGRMNVVRYGLDEWSKLFSPRQLLALTTFSDILNDVRAKIENDATHLSQDETPLRDGGQGRVAYADALITYLAFIIDKCADNWSTISTWDANWGKIRNTFARQAIPMTWDFAEVNPFTDTTGSWMTLTKQTVKALSQLPTENHGTVVQRDARARISEVGKCVISTDPPYYDNIGYADLSDYFYVWMRRNLKGIWPDEFATLLTPKADELIANSHRAGSKEAANKHFESGMESVFSQAAANSDERYPATIFYAFKASESEEKGNTSTGWETFLGGLLSAGYTVTATWPVRTEMANKIGVNAGHNMLASSIVLACRRKSSSASMSTRGEFINALRTEMAPALKILQEENIAPVDLAQSAIGPGIGIFSRYLKVLEADGQPMSVKTALSLINEVLAEVLSGEESEFDSDTRFAVTWFEQFGHHTGPFGDADTLAKAKNTTVNGVINSGIAFSRDGKLHLIKRSEYDNSWDPATDKRLTVWETTQHLINALEESESSAADLLRKLGPGLSERARQLAYLLYGICDRKKWASEAVSYNTLISAWPVIERLSLADNSETPNTNALF